MWPAWSLSRNPQAPKVGPQCLLGNLLNYYVHPRAVRHRKLSALKVTFTRGLPTPTLRPSGLNPSLQQTLNSTPGLPAPHPHPFNCAHPKSVSEMLTSYLDFTKPALFRVARQLELFWWLHRGLEGIDPEVTPSPQMSWSWSSDQCRLPASSCRPWVPQPGSLSTLTLSRLLGTEACHLLPTGVTVPSKAVEASPV